MTDHLIDSPGSTTAIGLEELKGRLLLLRPTRVEIGISTVLGPKDATVADVYVLDGEDSGRVYTQAYIWPKVLQVQLRPTVGTGRYCLGRLGQGVAKPGQSAPWKLADPYTPAPPVLTMRLKKHGATVAFFSTMTTLASPRDIMLQQLRIECFYPADAATGETARRLAAPQARKLGAKQVTKRSRVTATRIRKCAKSTRVAIFGSGGAQIAVAVPASPSEDRNSIAATSISSSGPTLISDSAK